MSCRGRPQLLEIAPFAAPTFYAHHDAPEESPLFVNATVGSTAVGPDAKSSPIAATHIEYAAAQNKATARIPAATSQRNDSVAASDPRIAPVSPPDPRQISPNITATGPDVTSSPSSDSTSAFSDIHADHGQQNLSTRITNLSPQTVALLVAKRQATVGVYFDGVPRYTFDGHDTSVWPDDGHPEYAMREYRLDGADRAAALRAVQAQFGYGTPALAQAEVRLLVRGEVDALILNRQLTAISSAKLSQADVSRTVGDLALTDAGNVADYRIRSIELKNNTVVSFVKWRLKC